MAHSRGQEPNVNQNHMDQQNTNIQLKCTNHQSKVFQALLNLYNSENLVDVTLAAEGKFVRAHKIILSACSPYFRDVLSIDVNKHPILFMSADTKFNELQAILNYMYKGETKINHQDLSALLKLATTLQVRGLAEAVGEPNEPVESVLYESMGHTKTHTQTSPECNILTKVELSGKEIPPVNICNNEPHSPQHAVVPTYFEPLPTILDSAYLRNPSTSTPTTPNKRRRREGTSSTSDIATQRIIQSRQDDIGDLLETGLGVIPNEIMISPNDRFEVQFRPELTEVKMESGLLDDEEEEAETFQIESNLTRDHDDSVGGQINCLTQVSQFDAQTPGPSHSGELHSTFSNARDSGGFKPFICLECHRDYLTKRSLTRHIKWECNKLPQFSCSICGARYSRRSSLKNHALKLLNEETEDYYVCPMGCGRKYLIQSSMQRHVRIECGKQPTLSCVVCEKNFKHRHRLKSHLKNIHKIKS